MSTSATEEGIILFSLGGPDIAFQESRAAYNNLDTHHPKAFLVVKQASFANSLAANWPTAKPHSPVHSEGWMISDQKTVFC